MLEDHHRHGGNPRERIDNAREAQDAFTVSGVFVELIRYEPRVNDWSGWWKGR